MTNERSMARSQRQSAICSEHLRQVKTLIYFNRRQKKSAQGNPHESRLPKSVFTLTATRSLYCVWRVHFFIEKWKTTQANGYRLDSAVTQKSSHFQAGKSKEKSPRQIH